MAQLAQFQFQTPQLPEDEGGGFLGKAFNVVKGAATGFLVGGPIGAAVGGGAALAGELIPGADQAINPIVDALGSQGADEPAGASPRRAGPGRSGRRGLEDDDLFNTASDTASFGQFATQRGSGGNLALLDRIVQFGGI